MKKRLSLILILICIISIPLISCGKKSSGSEYLSDFKFLPKYPGSEKISYKPPVNEGASAKASYKIPDTTPEEANTKYVEILKKDGWDVTQKENNPFINCTKGDHSGSILFTEIESETQMKVLAK